MTCYFNARYRKGRYPLFQVGPHWKFTIVLIVFAIFSLVYLSNMVLITVRIYPVIGIINATTIFLNLVAFLFVLFGDPGIHPEIYVNRIASKTADLERGYKPEKSYHFNTKTGKDEA